VGGLCPPNYLIFRPFSYQLRKSNYIGNTL
jgi:hypothetical protein